MKTFAEPIRRVLTDAALRGHIEDACPPKCRVCGHALKAGDFVDPHHPYEHRGNVHQRCAGDTPHKQGEPAPIACVRCAKPIHASEARESYTYPSDGRYVHSACVGELCREVLDLMARVPQSSRDEGDSNA